MTAWAKIWPSLSWICDCVSRSSASFFVEGATTRITVVRVPTFLPAVSVTVPCVIFRSPTPLGLP